MNPEGFALLALLLSFMVLESLTSEFYCFGVKVITLYILSRTLYLTVTVTVTCNGSFIGKKNIYTHG